MRFVSGVLAGFCVLALSGSHEDITFAQERTGVQALRVAPSHRITRYDDVIYSGGFLPSWDRGYLVTKELETLSPKDPPNVVLWDAEGKRAREARIWFDGAVRLMVRSVAVTPEGRIVAGGHAITKDGARASFIARTDLSGNVTDVVRTNPYGVGMICASPDGTVWAFGVDVEKHDAQQNYNMLRQFSFERGQLHEFVGRRSFATRFPPSEDSGGGQGSFLRCGKDKVGLYVNLTNEYIEMDLTASRGQRWQVDMTGMEKTIVTGLGITDDGRLLATLGDGHGGPSSTGHFGLFELEFDKEIRTAHWEQVPGAGGQYASRADIPNGVVSRLWGVQDDDLAVWRKGDQAHVSRAKLLAGGPQK